MAKKSKKEEKRSPIFEKVGLVFRNPVRADILKELSSEVQRPADLAKKFEMKRQAMNYHIGELKRGGLIKTHSEELPEKSPKAKQLLTKKGARHNGVIEQGKIRISYGVELTKNGKNLAKQFIEPLYQEQFSEKEDSERIKEKNKKKEDE